MSPSKDSTDARPSTCRVSQSERPVRAVSQTNDLDGPGLHPTVEHAHRCRLAGSAERNLRQSFEAVNADHPAATLTTAVSAAADSGDRCFQFEKIRADLALERLCLPPRCNRRDRSLSSFRPLFPSNPSSEPASCAFSAARARSCSTSSRTRDFRFRARNSLSNTSMYSSMTVVVVMFPSEPPIARGPPGRSPRTSRCRACSYPARYRVHACESPA